MGVLQHDGSVVNLDALDSIFDTNANGFGPETTSNPDLVAGVKSDTKCCFRIGGCVVSQFSCLLFLENRNGSQIQNYGYLPVYSCSALL